MRDLLTPDPWETAQTPRELTVAIGGKKLKAAKSANLGQAGALLDAVRKGETGAEAIILFS